MTSRPKHKQYIRLSLSVIGFGIFLSLTNPDNLPIGLLTLPFVWLFINIYLLFLLIFDLLVERYKTLSRLKRHELGILGASLPTLLLLLKSIDQLTIRDSLILIGIYVLLIFYISRVDFRRPI